MGDRDAPPPAAPGSFLSLVSMKHQADRTRALKCRAWAPNRDGVKRKRKTVGEGERAPSAIPLESCLDLTSAQLSLRLGQGGTAGHGPWNGNLDRQAPRHVESQHALRLDLPAGGQCLLKVKVKEWALPRPGTWGLGAASDQEAR